MKLARMEEADTTRSGTPTVYIRYKGIWDMQDLYQSMVDWFRERKYKFHELIYKHKHPSPFGIERQYVWRGEKKETEWLQFVVDIYIHTYDAHDVQVTTKDGSKKKVTKGRLWIEFRGHLVHDYEKRWEKTPFYKKMRAFYNKHVIHKKTWMLWWDQLWYREIHQLHALVKERLKMESEGYAFRYMTGVHR